MIFMILAEAPWEIGGHQENSYIKEGYIGRCEIKIENDPDTILAVLPNLNEAIAVARYAITPDGGYGSVEVHPSEIDITHSDFMDWLSN
jgi:hypothetical protein